MKRLFLCLVLLCLAIPASGGLVQTPVVDLDANGTPLYDMGRHVYGDSTRVRAGNDSTVAISDTLEPDGYPMNFVYQFTATDSALTAWVQFYELDDQPSADGSDIGTFPDTLVIYRWGDKVPIDVSGSANVTGELKVGGWDKARVYVTHEKKGPAVFKVPLFWHSVVVRDWVTTDTAN